jgi:hypothetical protein
MTWLDPVCRVIARQHRFRPVTKLVKVTTIDGREGVFHGFEKKR